jgi:hypothetical protein
MSASYRIIQADSAFAVEVTEPGRVPFIAGWLKSETAARAYIREQERMHRITDRLGAARSAQTGEIRIDGQPSDAFFVRRQKNDAADAEAITEAASRPRCALWR